MLSRDLDLLAEGVEAAAAGAARLGTAWLVALASSLRAQADLARQFEGLAVPPSVRLTDVASGKVVSLAAHRRRRVGTGERP